MALCPPSLSPSLLPGVSEWVLPLYTFSAPVTHPAASLSLATSHLKSQTKAMPFLRDYLVGICQLKPRVNSHLTPQACSPSCSCSPCGQHHGLAVTQSMSAVSPCSVQPHCLTPSHLESYPACKTAQVLLSCSLFFACHPACASSLPVALSWIPFILDFHTFPCSQTQLQHMPPHTSSLFHCWDFLSPHHNPLFSTCYILARSALMLSSLLDLIPGRRVSKSHKFDPEPCPQ